MDRTELYDTIMSMKGATEDRPFGPDTLVYKVMGKLFALIGADPEDNSVNLKCDPEHSVILRNVYPDDVKPGYHMNKKHWNTVTIDGAVPDDELRDMIRESYDLVVAKLKKTEREALKNS
ncbi:MAG: MmcQ/YjbR family DNA-binding protein [Chloroflexota bacterium]